MKERVPLRVATYNIGDYTGRGFDRGSEEGLAAIRAAMTAVGADLWALQEDVCCYGKEYGSYPRDTVYAGFGQYERCGCERYNYKAFLTTLPLTSVKRRFYTDGKFDHPWYLTGKVRIGEKTVTVISLHLDWSDRETRLEQIRQIIAYASQFEYVLIMGDFNTDDYENRVKLSIRSTHREDYSLFTDAGFRLANGGEFGDFHTFLDTANYPHAIDNIITSSGIRIVNAGVLCDGWMYDHAIMWADIEI